MTTRAKDIVTPTFIVGGAPKAGTTSLYHYLDQHPQVCMSARKETSVFIDDRGLEWLSETYYQHYGGEPAVGEASAGTLGDRAVARRVHRALPDVQLIFILRHPVERLYSHFTFLQSVLAIDRHTSFSAFIRLQSAWRDELLNLGCYHEHLVRFERLFRREQMLVLLFDNLKSDAAGFVEQVYRFIGVDPSFKPNIEVRNPTRQPRFWGAYRLLASVWATIRNRAGVYMANRTESVRRAVKRLITKEQARTAMPTADRAYLTEYYHEPNERLAQWLGRDLSHWQK